MAILGIGIDVVDLRRIEEIYRRRGEAFVSRICRPGECKPRREQALIEHLGGLFAAKEAALKALGTGWSEGLGFRQVEVVHHGNGAPGLRLHDAARQRSEHLRASHFHLSITHEQTYAAAVAILEGPPGTTG